METTINEKMRKLTFRIKATTTLHTAKTLQRHGMDEKLKRIFSVSCWYHEQAFRMGYDSSLFLLDFAEVLAFCGRNEESQFFYNRAVTQKKLALLQEAA